MASSDDFMIRDPGDPGEVTKFAPPPKKMGRTGSFRYFKIHLSHDMKLEK